MDEDFVNRLHAAALRARASGFDGIADAIEEILREELRKTSVDRTPRKDGQNEHNQRVNRD